MKSFVVYTVLTESQSPLNNPFPENCAGFERICFTDDTSIESNSWEIVRFHSHYLDPARASRRPKLLPHLYLQDFEWSLYIDNTVRLSMDPLEILNSHRKQAKYWCFHHPWRDCIYDEAEEVIRSGYDDERRVREQMDYYRELGYPKKAGLSANTILLRKHNDPETIQLGEIWFEHVLRFSKRDQLSFNFVARQLDFDYGFFEGQLTDNPFMVWPGHPGQIRVPADFDEYVYMWLNPEVRKSGLSARQHYVTVGAVQELIYRKKAWELDRLANKYKTDKGSIYYNAHAYAHIYERYFEPMRHQPITLLELGLLRHDVQIHNPGGPYDDTPSLFMWREYFPNATIIGFDIADFSRVPEIRGVKIVRGDMGNPDDLMSLVDNGPFDIIIDDASHTSHHQQIALGTLFPYLNSGGYYIIEDVNYQPPTLEQSGVTKTKEFLQGLRCSNRVGSTFMTRTTYSYFVKNVATIEFYDSFDRNFGGSNADDLVVIKKR